jgi:Domain of unknown function (DUF4386)
MILQTPAHTPTSGSASPPTPPTPQLRLAVQAGVGLLAIAALSAFGDLVVVQGLVTDGDAGRTAADVTRSSGLFGLGVSALYLVALLDVLVAWALLRFFEPVDSHLARLSAYLRMAYAAVFVVAISQLAGVPGMLGRHPGAFSTDQIQAQALARTEGFHDIWFGGLVLFGAHLVVLGFLVLRTTSAPRVVAILLAVAGVGYAFDTFHALLRPGTTLTVSAVTFVGEFVLALWLVARGGRVTGARSTSAVGTMRAVAG